MAQRTDSAVGILSEEPAWKQRAVERSTKAAKLRAERRVQRFLDAAQAIIMEKGTVDFTVQEVVDRARQSLRHPQARWPARPGQQQWTCRARATGPQHGAACARGDGAPADGRQPAPGSAGAAPLRVSR